MSHLLYQFKKATNERPELLKDKAFAAVWITKDWQTFQFFDRKIKDDENLALLACMGNVKALTWIPKRLRRNRNFVSDIIKIDPQGKSWNYIHFEFGDDEEMISALIDGNGEKLALASLRLQENKEIVLKAINSNPDSLLWAATSLKNDPEIVLAAIKKRFTTLDIGNRNLVFLTWKYVGVELKQKCEGRTGEDLIQYLKSMSERQKLQAKYQIIETAKTLAL